mmetsp:Transcript_8552/g.12205  ORF Transcript_8552/g.12205 Transcript_8552/m.12205 type:complete len:101 (+) Transcript_8552:94-396(+)
MIGVQREITERAIELLRLHETSEPKLVLDIGCGSGLSGKVLEEKGHVWIGCDVSRDMLDVANERIERKRKKENNDMGGMDSEDEEESEDEEMEDGERESE